MIQLYSPPQSRYGNLLQRNNEGMQIYLIKQVILMAPKADKLYN